MGVFCSQSLRELYQVVLDSLPLTRAAHVAGVAAAAAEPAPAGYGRYLLKRLG